MELVSYLTLITQIMKKIIKHFRETVVAGLILLIPVFVLILLIQKLYQAMTGVGSKISDMLGIKSVAGIGAASIATSVVLVGIFYGCGLLVKFAFVTRLKDWLEENLLQYIPGYLTYKSKMQEKLENRTEPRKAILAKINNGWRPGFLVNSQPEGIVVFIPSSPETDRGEIWVLQQGDIKEIGLADQAFIGSLQNSGKTLRIN